MRSPFKLHNAVERMLRDGVFESAAPDFVGIGVQKAGTSWWYEVIADHPLVFHPPRVPKERHFFESRSDDRDGRAYVRQFPRPIGTVSGEWTPRYILDRDTLEHLASALDKPRIIVMLRDPVDRAMSGLAHHEQRGRRVSAAVIGDAIRRSEYRVQVDLVREVFEPHALLFLQYERVVEDPRRWLDVTLDFIGLPRYESRVLSRTVNRSLAPKRPEKLLGDAVVRRLIAEGADVASDLGFDVDLWRSE